MDISATSAITGKGSTATTSASERSQLTRDEFLKLLTAELVNQDPFAPVDSKEFVGQLSQLQSLEATSALTDGIRSLVLGNELASAGALIGKTVTGKDSDGEPVEGLVEKVVVRDGRASLVVGGKQVPLAAISEIEG